MAEIKSYHGPLHIEAQFPTGVSVTYSDFAVVQSSQYGVALMFFQMELPPVDADDALEAFKKNPTVPARCVVRVALPHETARLLLEKLQQHLPREKLADEA